ncbi:hypothetical protein ADM96_15620 [Burkholderia sp. ST111]|nr:hypothetical protein ADM96_15620 [Burkholderia sp. ST111]
MRRAISAEKENGMKDDWQARRAAYPENRDEKPKPTIDVESFMAAYRRGEKPDPRDHYRDSARADAAPRRGELKQIKHVDPFSGSISYTYEGSKSAWMGTFKAEGYVQIQISNSSRTPTPAEQAAALQRFRLSHPNIKV